MRIGEIHWVELPDAGGREQSGRRPAIILQRKDMLEAYQQSL